MARDDNNYSGPIIIDILDDEDFLNEDNTKEIDSRKRSFPFIIDIQEGEDINNENDSEEQKSTVSSKSCTESEPPKKISAKSAEEEPVRRIEIRHLPKKMYHPPEPIIPQEIKVEEIPKKEVPKAKPLAEVQWPTKMPATLEKFVQLLLSQCIEIELPNALTLETLQDESCDDEIMSYTAQKLTWWFLKSETDPPNEEVFHPELHDAVVDKQLASSKSTEDEDEDDWADFESNFADVDEAQQEASDKDLDRKDEYCGLSTLGAAVRRPASVIKEKKLKYVFKVKPNTNYEKSCFEVKCFCCNELIKGQRSLGAHVRSKRHKFNCRKLSLDLGMAQYEETTKKRTSSNVFEARLRQLSLEEIASIDACLPISNIDDTDGSPQQNSKSATDKDSINCDDASIPEPSKENGETFLPIFEDYNILTDHPQNDAKLELRYSGKWTRELDEKWDKMKQEESTIIQKYNDRRERYIKDPESHPNHSHQWMKFWERRCDELVAQGKDPDKHDFSEEWKLYWFKGIQEILKADAEAKILQMKVRLGMDTDNLKKYLKRSLPAKGVRNYRRLPTSEFRRPNNGSHRGNRGNYNGGGRSWGNRSQETANAQGSDRGNWRENRQRSNRGGFQTHENRNRERGRNQNNFEPRHQPQNRQSTISLTISFKDRNKYRGK